MRLVLEFDTRYLLAALLFTFIAYQLIQAARVALAVITDRVPTDDD